MRPGSFISKQHGTRSSRNQCMYLHLPRTFIRIHLRVTLRALQMDCTEWHVQKIVLLACCMFSVACVVGEAVGPEKTLLSRCHYLTMVLC